MNHNITKKQCIIFALFIISINILFIEIIYSCQVNKVNLIKHYNEVSSNHQFNLHYQNDSKDVIKIRYKSVLTYETANNIEISNEWDFKKPLFNLSTDNNVVSESFLTTNKIPIVPDISDTITLDSKGNIDIPFEMHINEKASEFQDKIRFEIKIVVEELLENKWNPVYQVILMERGPYWSLDKGPIETIMPE